MSSVYVRFAIRGDIKQRAPLLERLLARARRVVRVADWRADAFQCIASPDAPIPPIAAAALRASCGAVPGEWVCLATPVHLVAGMSNVTLAQQGILDVDPAEARALASGFNQAFGGSGVRLLAGPGAFLFCVFDRALDAATRDPEEALGRDVFGFQPTGADAPRLRRLMSELEMWLFDHPLNRARAAQARPPLRGLWLWGGGPLLTAPLAFPGWTAGADPLFSACGAASTFPSDAGGGVVVCAEHPGSNAWPEAERRWLEPAVAALRAGRLERLELSGGDRRFTVERAVNWRPWRRPRSWWEWFGVEGEVPHGVQ